MGKWVINLLSHLIDSAKAARCLPSQVFGSLVQPTGVCLVVIVIGASYRPRFY